MKPTLYEIAQKTGVSISTVSRVLNNDQSKPASKETAEKVIQAAYEIGYLSPQDAVTKTTGERRHLLCLLSNNAYDYTDYFYSQILRGIEQEALAANAYVTQRLSSVNLDDATLSSGIDRGLYSGVILLGRLNIQKVAYIKASTPNVIYAGLNRVNGGIDEVICDSYDAVNSLVDYLVSCGHRKIGFIGVMPEEADSGVNEHRFTAYKDALACHHLPLNLRFCKNVELKSELAYTAALELAGQPELPDAIVCATDNVAIAAISALRNNGIRVPEDISVVGHDGIDISEFTEPKLTTTFMQKSELGRFAVRTLLDRIDGRHSIPILIKLPYKLEIRESCRGKLPSPCI